MNGIIEYFVKRSFVVNLVSAFIILAGVLLGSSTKRDTIPPFEWKQAQVRIALPGASATEVEKFLAYPVEQSLRGLPHAKEITTTSSPGSLQVSVYFDAGHDGMNESVEMIRSRIGSISWQLPQQSRDIQVTQMKVDSVFHMGFAMENFEQTNPLHRKLVNKFLDDLRNLEGMIDVNADMVDQNIYIKINPAALQKYEVSVSEIRQRINAALDYSPIGEVDFADKTLAVEVQRPAEAIGALKALAIRGNKTGDVLYLKELADVSLQLDKIKKVYRYNGQPVINVYSRKDLQTDTIELKERVLKVVEESNKNFPDGLKASVFLDGPHFIETQLSTLTSNGIFGLILVLTILTLFFNWKVALATSFGIPIAYCGTLVALYFLGISIDIISVVGMILVLGILVDDAIIIAERYIENLENGLRPMQAAKNASSDLIIPVTGTILTTIFAFAPMILLESEIANVFFAIPVVIIVSLIMSWLESFFILPNHLQHFIKRAPKPEEQQKFYLIVKTYYEKTLGSILRFRYVAVFGLIVFFVASGWVAKNKIQQRFWFGSMQERISVKIFVKDNVSLAHTEAVLEPIEKYLMSLPKEKFGSVATQIGDVWDMGRMYTGYRYARVLLNINKNIQYPSDVKEEYTKILKKHFKEYKDERLEKVVVGWEMADMNDKKNSMVSIEVVGNEDVDFLTLKNTIAQQIKAQNAKLELVEDDKEFVEKWVFVPDTEKLAQYQMGLSDITSQLRSFFVPHELRQMRLNGETKWIYTEINRDDNIAEKDLDKLFVHNRLDLAVSLDHLGHWEKKKQLSSINHSDGKRQFTFDLAFEADESMNVVQAKEQASLIQAHLAKTFPTYTISVKDADRAETASRAWALKVALLCIALVMFTLALVLNSITLPFIVGLPIPFGLMGIVWALYLHDMDMGIMSLIGLVGTVGVSVNDSLIMVDQIVKRGRRVGQLTRQHILKGASSRLRAIILTTVTTLGGVFPMAYGIGGESAQVEPLAFSLGWGLLFSTLLTLFALPAFIEIRRDFSRLIPWMKNKFGKTQKSKTIIEPSIKDKEWVPENPPPGL